MTQLSFLWPEGRPADSWSISAETIRDLELEALLAAICPHGPYREVVRPVMFRLCLDAQTIRHRQAVLADLRAHPPMLEALQSLLPLLDELALYLDRQIGQGSRLHEVVARAGELELLIEAVHRLQQAYSAVKIPLQSPILLALQERVQELAASSDFNQLVQNLPPLLAQLRTSASITLGVNLNHSLQPEEAILLSVNDYRFSESTLLDKLLGKGAGEGKGIASLHTPPLISKSSGMITGGMPTPGPVQRMDPLLVPLFKDLSQILEKVTQPIAQELKQFVHINSRFLSDLRPDIIFFVHVLDLMAKVEKAGLPICLPQIDPAEERICQVQGAYNMQLAIQGLGKADVRPLPERVVANDIDLGQNGRIAILTGPNQGGKTTYMQSVGLVQVLGQLGLPVPGTQARISPVDAIYSHYPIEERLDLGTGRFGDEAQRIRAIFEQITRRSLVLFNESLATTNLGESVYLARDIVRTLRQVGCRAVYTTHLHDLAAAVERINADTEGDSMVISLVASSEAEGREENGRYSFHVRPGPPLGRSYAENIAAQYGIRRDQLLELLRERDMLP